MRILLAEDDETLNKNIKEQLLAHSFQVDTCFDGEDALYYGEQNIYDVILLDRMLPSMEGTKILQELRSKDISTPVILITALGTLSDKVTGLNLGADDYLVKPFAFEELLARIYCVTRRSHTLTQTSLLAFADVTYHPDRGLLEGPKSCYSLSKREGALLEFFLHNPEQPLSRNTLLLKVWGPDSEVEEGNLDNYILFIRRRLSHVGSTLVLKNIRGIGFCLQKGTAHVS